LVAGAVGLVYWSLLLRYRRRELPHKERLAALEKGVALPELHDETYGAGSPRVYLLRGMMWLFSGIAIMIVLGAISQATQQPRALERRLYDGNRLKELGATEEQIRSIQNDTTPRDGMPFAVALLGLIPASVGLAYLIFYGLEGKKRNDSPRMDANEEAS
jgi:hypothetical protein